MSHLRYLVIFFVFLMASCQNDAPAKSSNDNASAVIPKKVEKKVTETKTKENSSDITSETSNSKASENSKIDHRNVDLSLLENLIHREINKARRANGVGQLANDRTLRKAAVDQNNYCLRNTDLTHSQNTPGKRTIKDRVEFYGTGYTVMAENLIYEGFTVRRTNGVISDILTPSYRELAKTMVVNWMNSPGHRANIVEGDLDRVGTAVAYNPNNYAVYATQVFGAK